MTYNEKMEMWLDKKKFIDAVNGVFQTTQHNSTVTAIIYEVYEKQFDDRTGYKEYVIIHFSGGAISPMIVSGNSNIANLRVLSDKLNGGYYCEVEEYRSLFSNGWELIL